MTLGHETRDETPRWDRLSPATAARLEEAAFGILERTGVEVPVKEALDLWRRAGAAIDESRVRIPARLVRWALETAPTQVTLHDRDGRPVLHLRGRNHFFGTGSDCLNVLDHRTGKRRRATLAHGVEGSYLETDHRFTHYRECWYPTLIDRRGYEAWRAGGATTLAQRARGRVEELLASHAPTPLDPDVETAVRAVVERVQAAAGL